MALSTRLTARLSLQHPIISAPMAFAAGGRLASAVSAAGGLGLIGGGYGDQAWLEEQLELVDPGAAFGCGFITWSLARQPQLLELVLERKPKAIFLSFGDPAPFADRVKRAGATLICQIQTLRDADHAIGCGADIIVAQGAEAGGHGEGRGTFALVPEVADLIARRASQTLLCAAGGVGDGRGLAAALMLGADGVLVGSRFWASKEASVGVRMHAAALAACGDDTIRSQVMDLARKLDWPTRYTARVLKNAYTAKWHGREAELMAVADEEAAKYRQAWSEVYPEGSNTFVGEVVGLIDEILSAGEIIRRLVEDAEARLTRFAMA